MEALSLTRLRVRPEPVNSAISRVVNIRVDTEHEQQILDLDGQVPMRLKPEIWAQPLQYNEGSRREAALAL